MGEFNHYSSYQDSITKRRTSIKEYHILSVAIIIQPVKTITVIPVIVLIKYLFIGNLYFLLGRPRLRNGYSLVSSCVGGSVLTVKACQGLYCPIILSYCSLVTVSPLSRVILSEFVASCLFLSSILNCNSLSLMFFISSLIVKLYHY